RAVVEELRTNSRAQLIMPCGTGKTDTGATIAEQIAPQAPVLIVVPTLGLLTQTVRVYASRYQAGLIAAVCSEAEATAEAARMRDELRYLHGGVSTDPRDIAQWLRHPGRVTIFSTY